MSAILGKTTRLAGFYRSSALPCPYIAGQLERKLFTRLSTSDPNNLNARLTLGGFRRSHDFVYRPICDHCSACVPVRIVARRHDASRSVRRVLARNRHLQEQLVAPRPTAEQFALFLRYQHDRHGDGDMASMGPEDYAAMIVEGSAHAGLIEWRDTRNEDRLAAVMLVDQVQDGWSAVYSFFDPDLAADSLGRFMVYRLVDRCRLDGLSHVYLGYLIRQSPKMAYKAQFSGLEALERGEWQPLDQTTLQG